jgi:hypothetical protein
LPAIPLVCQNRTRQRRRTVVCPSRKHQRRRYQVAPVPLRTSAATRVKIDPGPTVRPGSSVRTGKPRACSRSGRGACRLCPR